jgi:glycosyltransferase involved in cell wall biosynthesis
MILLGVPHVLRASSFEPFLNDANKENSLDFKALKLLEKLQASLSPHIYAPSQNLQQLMKTKQRLDRVRIIQKPILPELAGWDYTYYDKLLKDKEYLLFFGRFEERKGFHILVPALARVLADNPNMRAALIGQDVATASHASMAQYAHSLCGKFGDRFILLDKLRQPQLYPIVARAKLIVLPSLADAMPYACLEGMYLGRPVLATWGSGFDEVITDDETGFLVTPNSVDALVEKIIHAWDHPGLETIGNAAKTKMSEFSPDKTTSALLSYYQEVLLSREQSQAGLWRRRAIAKPALP